MALDDLTDRIVTALLQNRDVIRELIAEETPFEDGVLPIEAGGTSATSASAARSALGTNDAGNITAGTLAIARGGTGATSASAARTNLGTHDAANITTGTLDPDRLGSSPTASKFLKGNSSWATIAAGDLPSHNHSGSDINSGTVAPARLGSGSPSSSNYLRGDGSWASISTLGGSGTSGRIAQWTGSGTLGDSTLAKSGGGVLTLSCSSTQTLTILSGGEIDLHGNKIEVNQDTEINGYTAGAPAATGYVSILLGATTYRLLAST